MKARIISVENQDKGKYNSLKIAFRNLESNKVLNTNILSFTFPDVFATLKGAEVDSVWDVKAVKNDAGFWDWSSVKPASEVDEVPSPATKKGTYSAPMNKANVAGRDFESKAERAIRQVLIVRQSSITAATAILNPTTPDKVFELAAKIEDWVFRGKAAKAVSQLGNQSIKDLDDDIPY